MAEPQQPPAQRETQQEEKPQEEKRVDFKFPLLILRTKRFGKVFDRLGALKSSRYVAWLLLGTVPFVAGIALYLLINSLIATLTTPGVGQVARELGPASVLLLPGINPMLPIVYGWIAIVVAIVIHEGAHGVIARSEKLGVKSSGLVFFLIIPIGAFVDVDEEDIKKARSRSSVKVMAGGVGANVILGVVCLIAMLAIVGSVSPVIDGVYVNSVSDGLPAQAAGLQAKDVLVSINGVAVHNTTELRTVLDAKNPGDFVNVTVARGNQWQTQYTYTINLTRQDNRTVMGISSYDLQTQARLDNYRNFQIDRLAMYIIPPTLAEGLVPFSDFLTPFYTSAIGGGWAIACNTLFWLWFVNFNLAIFNALPIYPFDGGRILDITLKRYFGKKLSDKTIHRITVGATAACVALVLAVTILPFFL